MYIRRIVLTLCILLLAILPGHAEPLSSSNIPLDSPLYLYLEKLTGMGLVSSDVKGLKPFSRAEAARLTLEAEQRLREQGEASSPVARAFVKQLKRQLAREVALRNPENTAKWFDATPVVSARLRYVYLDGVARNYTRTAIDPGHQSAFGFIGGDLRPFGPGQVHVSGTEGTPLLENNNGTIHPRGQSGELRVASEGYVSRYATLLLEPKFLVTQDKQHGFVEKGYLTLGGGGLALEVGRDENWFGPGYRGATVLTNNARNFDQIKLWSPEPLDVAWIKQYLGDIKYALLFSRFDKTGSGSSERQPYLAGLKLAIKPADWWELGANFVRQFGGPGFQGSPDTLFGGGLNDHSNSIAGLDLRFRIPWLRNTELYGEFSGEDNAGGVWPIVESYVAGLFIPCLTGSCQDDFRFEYFFGSVMLYGDWQFPTGYSYHGMTPGHSQGGAGVQEFYGRYSHWFDVHNNLALEYFYTERGRSYRMPGQEMESKHAGRVSWTLPLVDDLDVQAMYGIEGIRNVDLVAGTHRTNQLIKLELRYRY